MKLHVFGRSFSGEMKRSPEEILDSYHIDYEYIEKEGNMASYLTVDITAEQLYSLCSDSEFDLMVSSGTEGRPGFMAFDAKGRRFRHR